MPKAGVLFNEDGRSIESAGFIFKGNKWRECYILCSQPTDIRSVIFFVFRKYKHRVKKKESSAHTLDTFVGLETGFELRKKKNTLCIITRCDLLIVSFLTAECLVLWEAWINQTCSRGSMFFAQLINASENSRAHSALNREVRIHIHDGRFALVVGHPQLLIGYWLTSDIVRVGFIGSGMHFYAQDRLKLDEGIFTLVCGQIDQLEKHFIMSQEPKLLLNYLNRKSGDGPWLDRSVVSYSRKTRDSKYSSCCNVRNSNDITSRQQNGFIASSRPECDRQQGEGNDEKHSSTSLASSKSDSNSPEVDLIIDSQTSASLRRFRALQSDPSLFRSRRVAVPQNSILNSPEGSVKRETNGETVYVNVMTESEKTDPSLMKSTQGLLCKRKYSSTAGFYNGQFVTGNPADFGRTASASCNITSSCSIEGSQNNSNFGNSQEYGNFTTVSGLVPVRKQHSLSPGTVSARSNVFRAESWPKHVHDIHQNTDENSSQLRCSSTIVEPKGKYIRQHQKLARTKGRDVAVLRDKQNTRLHHHQRSRSVALDVAVKRSGSTREENWDRAKKIIGGIRRSTNGSRGTASASLDKLVGVASCGSKNGMSQAVTSEATNDAATENAGTDASTKTESVTNALSYVQAASPIPGLVKLPQDKFGLRRIGNILTKSLRKSITGSYSKYDGERATHHYNPEDAKDLPLIAPIADCIESAVKKGRARLIEADRRKSSFADGLHSTNFNGLPNRMSPRCPLIGSTSTSSNASLINSARRGSDPDSNPPSDHQDTLSANTPRKSILFESGPPSVHSSIASVQSVRSLALPDIPRNDTSNSIGGIVNITDSEVPPPLQPKIYTKKKKLSSTTSQISGRDIHKQKRISSSQNRMTGAYSDLVPSEAPSRRPSCDASRTVYTEIDPIATTAACKVQEEMMREREMRCQTKLPRLIARHVSSGTMYQAGRRNSDQLTNSSGNRGFFVRHFFKKPSSSLSQSDLLF